MKKPFTLLFIATVVILSGVPIAQSFKVSQQKKELTAALTHLETTSNALQQLQEDNDRLKSESRELRRQLQDLRLQAATASPAPTLDQSEAANELASTNAATSRKEQGEAFRGFLSKMMDDPEMRKFIRNQQRQMLDPLYQPLIKKLELSKDEANAFKDFLADTQMKATQNSTAMLNGTEAERKEAMDAMSAEQKENEQYIREFLGEDRYAQYKDYQETLGERMQLNQFKLQTAGDNALTDDQTEWLLNVMKEEKQAVAKQTGNTLPDANQDPAAIQKMLSDNGADQYLKTQEAVNQRVYERAAETLSPEQLESFSRFQSNQLQMMRMGMSMAKEMFAPDASKVGPGASGQ